MQDGLGSVRNLVNSVSSVVNSYDYYAFGETYGTITAPVANRYMFTAREWDAESGTYNYRPRQYNQVVGRFNRRDDIEYEGGINLYTYVGNNAVNAIDPFGKATIKIWPEIPGKKSSWGHAAVKLKDGTYASFWPNPATNEEAKKVGMGKEVPAQAVSERFDKMEGDVYTSIELDCLDEGAVKTEWDKILGGIKNKTIKYKAIGSNCATIAGRIIAAGMTKNKPNCPASKTYTSSYGSEGHGSSGKPVTIIERWVLKSCFDSESGEIPGTDTPNNLKSAVECLVRNKCNNYYCEKEYTVIDPNPKD